MPEECVAHNELHQDKPERINLTGSKGEISMSQSHSGAKWNGLRNPNGPWLLSGTSAKSCIGAVEWYDSKHVNKN